MEVARKLMSEKMNKIYDSFPQALKKFWKDTALSIPNAYLFLMDIAYYDSLMGTDRVKRNYAFTRLAPAPRGKKMADGSIIDRDFFAPIVVPVPPNVTDTAHEIAHYYLHGILDYPFLVDKFNGVIIDDLLDLQKSIATRIYDIAVHPTIDKVLQ